MEHTTMSDKNGLVEVWLQNDFGLRPKFEQSAQKLQDFLTNCGGNILSINDEGNATIKVSPAGKAWLQTNGHEFVEHLPVAGENNLAVFNAGDVTTLPISHKIGLTA